MTAPKIKSRDDKVSLMLNWGETSDGDGIDLSEDEGTRSTMLPHRSTQSLVQDECELYFVLWVDPPGIVQGEAFDALSAAQSYFHELARSEHAPSTREAITVSVEFIELEYAGSHKEVYIEMFEEWYYHNHFLARIAHAHQRADRLRTTWEDRKIELERIGGIWQQRQEQLESEVKEITTKINFLKAKYEDLEDHIQSGAIHQGPSQLSWVESSGFLLAASIVIMANLLILVMETVHPEDGEAFWILNEFFLLFYLGEFILKAAYHRHRLLCGSWRFIIWNWLDFVLLVLCIVDEWVLPHFQPSISGDSGPDYANVFRFLRLARLARIFKIVHIFLKSEMVWAESTWFQAFILCVITCNALLMGIELETHNLDNIWYYVEQLLLLIFTFELAIRIKRHRCSFFTSSTEFGWNWLDFVIVMGGILDQWMMPLMDWGCVLLGLSQPSTTSSRGFSQTMNLLRMMRLLRILRLVRLIKNIPPLLNLVVGIAQAMQGMGWVMVLTSAVLYICALLGVKMLGPRGLLWVINADEDADLDAYASGNHTSLAPEGAAEAFPDIFGAIFNLFKVMNADMSPMAGLMDALPAFKFIVVFYVVLTNWSIFSILTAVVSDHMARVTEEHDSNAKEIQEARAREKLVDTIFDSLDRTQSGKINSADLRALCESQAVCQKLFYLDVDDRESEEVAEFFAGINLDDLRELIEIVARADDGLSEDATITREEFLSRLQKEGSTINQRSIMRVEKRLETLQLQLNSGMSRLRKSIERGQSGAAGSGGGGSGGRGGGASAADSAVLSGSGGGSSCGASAAAAAAAAAAMSAAASGAAL